MKAGELDSSTDVIKVFFRQNREMLLLVQDLN